MVLNPYLLDEEESGMARNHLVLLLSRRCLRNQRRVTTTSCHGAVSLMRCYSTEQRSVADRFSWLLTENNQSGVVDGLKETYK